MTIECPVLTSGGLIPSRYAYTGVPGAKNISLPVKWSGLPRETASCALSIIDIHPIADNWVHWCLVNLPPSVVSVPEGASGQSSLLPPGSIECRNTYGTVGYGGPKPPRGSGPHEYVITVFALSVPALSVAPGSEPGPVLSQLKDLEIGKASVVGIFEQ